MLEAWMQVEAHHPHRNVWPDCTLNGRHSLMAKTRAQLNGSHALSHKLLCVWIRVIICPFVACLFSKRVT